MSSTLNTMTRVVPGLISEKSVRYSKKQENDVEADGLPGSYGLPIIGHSLAFMTCGPAWMSKCILKYGPLFRTHVLLEKRIVVTDPEVGQYLLRQENKLVCADWPKPTATLLGEGSLTVVHGESHVKMRQLLTTAFQPNIIRRLSMKVTEAVEHGLLSWCEDGVKNFKVASRSLTLGITLRAVLGTKDLTERDFDEMRRRLVTYGHGLFSLPADIPGTGYHAGLKARAELLDMIQKLFLVAEQRVKDRDDCMLLEDVDDEPDCILDQLIRAKSEDCDGTFNGIDIANNCLVLLFAGMDTSASTVHTLVTMLAFRPEVVENLRKEQERVISECGESINPSTLEKMKYLDTVISEFFQVIAVIGAVFRIALKDFHLPGTNLMVRKGQRILVSFHGQLYHHNPIDGTSTFKQKVFELFNPDKRFREAQEGVKTNKVQNPFGQGLRRCIGEPFASLVIRTILVTLIRKYDFEVGGSCDGIVPEWSWFPVPGSKHKLPLTLTRRNKT